jgi:hypothetical protein
MSCQGAADYYDDHFRCHVYEDLTPPEQDSDVRVRCVHGDKAFRFEYAV